MYIYSVNDIKYQPLFDGLTDYWRPVDAANGDYTAVNPNAKYPRMYGQNPTVGSNYGRKTDKYLSNAAYFRIKNVTLSYTVPKTWISRIGLNQLKGYQNIFVAVTCFCQCRKSGNFLFITFRYRSRNSELELSGIPYRFVWYQLYIINA